MRETVPKILGIETEYGVVSPGGESDPVALSSRLVNAYADRHQANTHWDFEAESPGRDARAQADPYALAPSVEIHLANTVLTNGARYYVDHAHPEYSSPECASPMSALRYDLAGEEVMRRSMHLVAARFSHEPPVLVYKNNSDGKGNSYGCHENYMLSRDLAFEEIVHGVLPHFVSRQIYLGAGKVGSETEAFEDLGVEFQLSQRAEFIEEVVGLETTLKRPIVNTRDEPHADPKLFRRLHVIIGDANMSETATFMKLATTAMLLSMLEAGTGPKRKLQPYDPVGAVHQVSLDLSLMQAIRLSDGSSMTALEMQYEILAAAKAHQRQRGFAEVADEAEIAFALDTWTELLDGLARNPEDLADRVDWIAKRRILNAFSDRHGLAPLDARMRAVDLQYHDLRPEKSLAARCGLRKLIDSEDILSAVDLAPRDTRAFFRGACLARFPKEVITANWDSLVFDLGGDPLRRVAMMDPLKGTAEYTEALLDDCVSASELLERLGNQ